MIAIFKREVRSSFHGMIGYVLTAFMLAATAIYFIALNLGYGLTDFGYYTLYRTVFVLLLYIPVLTMRCFAEERRTRTDQLLLTSPVSVWGIVLGKFLALCVIFALPCLVDAVMILVLAALGASGTATAANFAALLCYFLMGCAAIAIGVFLSSLTENQIIAAVAGVAALLLAYMMPSLRNLFTAGSAVALALFTAVAAVLSVVAGLRTRSFTLGCLTFAGCCVVLTALFLLTEDGLTGGLLQVFFHAWAKIGLFLIAGVIIHLAGLRNVEDFRGLGRRLPVTFLCLVFVSLSLVGIPPFGGFVSKWAISLAALDGLSGPLAYLVPAVLLVSALLTAGYLFAPIVSGFFPGEGFAGEPRLREPPAMTLPLVVLATVCLVLGLFPDRLTALFQSLAAQVL